MSGTWVILVLSKILDYKCDSESLFFLAGEPLIRCARVGGARPRELIGLFVIAAGFMGITPLLSTNRVTDFMIFCMFAMSFHLINGYMGRLSFGHLLFLGIGLCL